MLTYWEHFDNELPESFNWNINSAEILFPKKRENGKCLQIRKLSDGKYHLCLSYYVGLDVIPNTNKVIYVAPKLNTRLKLDGTPDNNIKIEDIQQTDYLNMLFSALKHPEITNYTDELFNIKWDSPLLEINQQQDLLTPLLVVQYLKIVQSIVRKGLKKSYYKVERNLNGRVKGKVLVAKTIKQNILKNSFLKTYCSYDEFGFNGLENRLLKKALVFIQRYLPTLKNLKSEAYTESVFNYINPAFEGVSDEVSLYDVKHTKTNVFYKEYEVAIHLAKIILKRFGYNIKNTIGTQKIKTPPYWIDMSKLFELYVFSLLQDRFGKGVSYHPKWSGNELDFLLNNSKYKMVIDAKYKEHYQTSHHKDDMWQISGYSRLAEVYKKLEKRDDEIVDCLIIYPDQKCDNKTLHGIDFTLDQNKIKEYVRVFKIPVVLPTISNK